jgi:hypothetical protein
MSEMLAKAPRKSLLAATAVAALLLVAWFAYRPAMNSVFMLDDFPNLAGLEAVVDAETALQFVVSGTAGPVGRPLSLATFAAQAQAWDESATPFIGVNIAIHLLNGLLACLLFLQLVRAAGGKQQDDRLIAIAGMALWLFMPLLASSSLMIVQRMTTLSATFVLLGLNGYLFARSRYGANENAALAGMTSALAFGTLLAVLAKENGALLPSLALVMEATLLKPPATRTQGKWRTWSLLCLGVPTLAVIVFLLGNLPYSEDTVLRRGMSAWERLLTQSGILWEYLINAFVPRPAQFGPYHDGHALARSLWQPVTLVATFAWLAAITTAVAWRRKYPLPAFAVLWFVTGHLLESTTVPLELYFEHRNYMPLLGPVFVICYLLLSVTGEYRNVARFATAAYLFVQIAILVSVTTLWGRPLEAATYWSIKSPHSVRAAAHLASRQMTEIGGPVGVVTLQEFVARHPQHAYLRIHELSVSCRMAAERDYAPLVEYLEEALPSIRFDFSVSTMLDNLMLAISETGCSGIDRDTGRRLAEAVASNPAYAGDSRYMSSHYLLMAGIALEGGDQAEAMRLLERAGAEYPSNRVTSLVVSNLTANRRFEEARSYIGRVEDALPMHPLRRLSTSILLRQLMSELETIEAQAAADSAAQGITKPD